MLTAALDFLEPAVEFVTGIPPGTSRFADSIARGLQRLDQHCYFRAVGKPRLLGKLDHPAVNNALQ